MEKVVEMGMCVYLSEYSACARHVCRGRACGGLMYTLLLAVPDSIASGGRNQRLTKGNDDEETA